MTYDFKDIVNIRAGLAVVSFVGLLSFLGSGTLLVFSLRKLFTREDYDPLQPVTVMFMYWIFCDLFQALGTMAYLRWALEGAVEEGTFCSAQAAFRLTGVTGAALCVIEISVLVLVRVMKPSLVTRWPRQISLGLVVFTSLVLLCLVLVPATVISGYFGVSDSGVSCWVVHVNGTTTRLGVGTEYVLMWIACLTETLVSGYLLLRKLARRCRWFGITPFDAITFHAVLGMFWYAVAYAIEVIPVSVIRLRQICHHNTSHGWNILSMIMFSAAGFVNAILFFSTGRRFGFSDGWQRAETGDTFPLATAHTK